MYFESTAPSVDGNMVLFSVIMICYISFNKTDMSTTVMILQVVFKAKAEASFRYTIKNIGFSFFFHELFEPTLCLMLSSSTFFHHQVINISMIMDLKKTQLNVLRNEVTCYV